MPLSPAIPGLFFCFAATVLLIIVSVSVPVWDQISFLNVQSAGGDIIRYGCFGYTGSKTTIGYDFVGANLNNTPINSFAVHNLTKALILHPIAAGLSGLAFLFGLCGAASHRTGTVFMTLLSGLALVVTLVIFIIDLSLFGITRNRFRVLGYAAQYGNANWLVIGAVGALLFAFMSSCCGVFGRYRKKKGSY